MTSHDYHMISRDWRDCRDALLKRFKSMVDGISKDERKGGGGEVMNMLLDIVDEESAHNYALLLLWASQSNAVPVSCPQRSASRNADSANFFFCHRKNGTLVQYFVMHVTVPLQELY